MLARVEILRLATAAHLTGATVHLHGLTPLEGLLSLLFIGAARRAWRKAPWSIN